MFPREQDAVVGIICMPMEGNICIAINLFYNSKELKFFLYRTVKPPKLLKNQTILILLKNQTIRTLLGGPLVSRM